MAHGYEQDDAFEVYRAGWFELQRWRGSQRDEALVFVEDLTEALLDLKQSVINEEESQSARYVSEVLMLMAELRRLRGA